jgi:hypothetical protein
MDPGPFTLRRLDVMVRARLQVQWVQTAHLLAALARCATIDLEFDAAAWMPEAYREKPQVPRGDPVEIKRAEIAAFNAELRRGQR